LSATADEKIFDFSTQKLNEPPEGFRSTLTGFGKAGDWKIILDREQSVLGQLAQERIETHFPLLVFDGEIFDDFVLQTRLKLVGGQDEQMAGIAFRIRDEKNYYYIRASALGDTFAFFRVINGELSSPVSSKFNFETNVWYDLVIDCKANEIHASLGRKELLLVVVRDAPLSSGKVGFWTKSDSVSYFGRTKITYSPRQILAQKIVRDTLTKYPRLRGINIFAAAEGKPEARLVAGTNPAEIGRLAQALENDVIARGAIYYGKENDSVLVTFPLHDVNGDTVAAIKLMMKSFPGQTEKNALARALPIVKEIESRIQRAADLLQ
jgi:hypothetical protein